MIRYDPKGVAWTYEGWEKYLRLEWARMPVVLERPAEAGAAAASAAAGGGAQKGEGETGAAVAEDQQAGETSGGPEAY